MYAFTILTRRISNSKTTHINTVEVPENDAKAAALEGRETCAHDWDVEPEDLIVFGVFPGSHQPCMWDDEECVTNY